MSTIEIQPASRRIASRSTTPRARNLPDTADPSLDVALELSQDVVDKANQQIIKRRQQEETRYILNSSIETSDIISRTQSTLKSNTTEAEGYTDALMEQADSIYSESLANAPSEEARLRLLSMYSKSRTALLKDSLAFEKTLADEALEADLDTNLNLLANSIADDPSTIATRQGEIDLLIAGAKPSKQVKIKQAIADAQIRGSESSQALDDIDKGNYDEVFTPKELEKYSQTILDEENAKHTADAKKAKEVSDSTLFDYALRRSKGETITATQIQADVDAGILDPNDARTALKNIESGAQRQVDDIETLIQFHEKLASGSLDTRWIAQNAHLLKPTTVSDGIERVTSGVAQNPTVRRSLALVDTLFPKDELTGLLIDEDLNKIRAGYQEDIFTAVQAGENPLQIASEIMKNHKVDMLNAKRSQVRDRIISEIGGIDKVNLESLNRLGVKIKKKFKSKKISEATAKEQAIAIKELMEELQNVR